MSIEQEAYECDGCGGEVSIAEAIWLPQSDDEQAVDRPYCCQECRDRRTATPAAKREEE
jgi:hypothetical protein